MGLFLLGLVFIARRISIVTSLFFLKRVSVLGVLFLAAFFRVDC